VDGQVEAGTIRCSIHGVAFSLETGEVAGLSRGNCGAIGVYPVEEEMGDAVIEIDGIV